MAKVGKITERTLYPHLISIIRASGGSGISEVKFNSEPDIVFDLLGYKWLMSVKIGENQKIIKDAFVQYFRHRRESNISHGMILFFPEETRKVKATEAALNAFMEKSPVTCLVDAPTFQDQIRDSMTSVFTYVLNRINEKLIRSYPLDLVVSLLRQHIEDMMSRIDLTESELIDVITDPKLFFGIGGIQEKQKRDVLRFLATYILISQLLFLRLYSAGNPTVMSGFKEPSRADLKKAFKRVWDINYKPVYNPDVLGLLPEDYVKDAFDLIWGLRIEKLRYEIPGRLFHELMPEKIRKLLAAFYTRPQAADLLANLTISKGRDKVLDPACGSGTILTSAYRRKLEAYKDEGHADDPHKFFCENDIYGADIMPFAVHLTTANLAAMNPSITIDRAQIVEGDSLKLQPLQYVKPGMFQQKLFREPARAYKRSGEGYEVEMEQTDVVLMNPPFTKIERGISDYIDMSKFKDAVGGEVGLWAHFVALGDSFLKKDGVFGGVLPISLLRGRETNKVREYVFSNWTPLYIIKPTLNYGFTEWAEYRDILFIAQKRKKENRQVKFCLVKTDLKQMSQKVMKSIAQDIRKSSHMRSATLDVESVPQSEVQKHFNNLMWFCGVSDFSCRDTLTNFLDKFNLSSFPSDYFGTGHRIADGVADFMFLTRQSSDGRVEEAFLRLVEEGRMLKVRTPLNVEYRLKKEDFRPSLRTAVGLTTMDIDGRWDYIAEDEYEGIEQVLHACGKKETRFPDDYWTSLREGFERSQSKLVFVHRFNPFSPNAHLIAFYCRTPLVPSDMFNIVFEPDDKKAKALCVLMNSAIFLASFFLQKEETTGRYINLRLYDMEGMSLYPSDVKVCARLADVYDKYSSTQFPSFRKQLDKNYEGRYEAFWNRARRGQSVLFEHPSEPDKTRIAFDMDIAEALGVHLTENDLREVYDAIVQDMIVIRGLTRD